MSTIVAKTGTRNWSTDSDWVGEVQPAAGDTAVIPAGCTMNGEVIAANILVIVEQGGELDLVGDDGGNIRHHSLLRHALLQRHGHDVSTPA